MNNINVLIVIKCCIFSNSFFHNLPRSSSEDIIILANLSIASDSTTFINAEAKTEPSQ